MANDLVSTICLAARPGGRSSGHEPADVPRAAAQHNLEVLASRGPVHLGRISGSPGVPAMWDRASAADPAGYR